MNNLPPFQINLTYELINITITLQELIVKSTARKTTYSLNSVKYKSADD